MLKNYFKIAIAVLKRRKFFTFISLFGISLTLTILIVLSAFLDVMLSPAYPDVKRSRELFISRVVLKSDKGNYTSQSPSSLYFIKNFVSTMKRPEKIAVHTGRNTTNAYQNNKKMEVELMYTNVPFWEVYEFDFIEGKPFNGQDLENVAQVAVISEDTRAKYFGESSSALGRYVEANNIKYRVIGVVKNVPATMIYANSDVYLPYTLDKANLDGTSIMGDYLVTLLAKSTADLPLIKEEYQQLLKKVPHPEKNQELLLSKTNSYLESFTEQVFGNVGDSGKTRFFLMIGVFVFLFMLLPTINLVNINVSRIMERSSEIGVRKAFGASSRTLVGQFIVENMILTVLGGVLGILLSFVIISILNASGLIAHMNLVINLTVLGYSLLACLVFGLMSGVYPAWRMSKLNVVTALKANN
ncbi:ABC transporter permease [Pedobacter caeni]|uniref:Putative ABC transport system permease protein n=1 Tax=Pedobacter caeni TaxID=288992 RepID=A0A1M5MRT5_9SPHI|nr:ABC transporter permease [Pedobacter caeni]SHG79936.1 putative ABC transport system permease protein [Pedobacter caeni]